jgi:5-methylcytosine-specific restriction endonuclease McrA
MTELQKEFLRLHVILQLKYPEISERLKVKRSELTEWYEKLRPEREEIAKIRNVWSRKKITSDFEPFYNWYIGQEKKCAYCGITEAEINALIANGNLKTKRINTRGRTLEFDRKEPDLPYNQLDNIVLCCYWCNNAKTDTFTYDEFKKVGKVFSAIWKNRFNNLNR